jgi:hypothetical protein
MNEWLLMGSGDVLLLHGDGLASTAAERSPCRAASKTLRDASPDGQGNLRS